MLRFSRPFLPLVLPVLLLAQSPAAPTSPQAPAAQAAPAAPPSPNAVDDAAVAFFLEEGLQRSQVMDHLSWLCDVYGPRVTGSPNIRKAQKWATETFATMGMKARTEQWGPFGRGWRCDHVMMAVTGDNPWPVIAFPKAWSPGIQGCVEAEVVHVAALTAEQLEAADLAGKIVLIEPVREVKEPFDGISKRHDAESLLRLADQQRSEAQRPAVRAAEAAAQVGPRAGFQRQGQMMAIVNQKRPLAIVDRASKGDYGTVFVQGASAVARPGAADAPRGQRGPSPRDADAVVIPQFTIAVEHYNRMCRLLAKGLPVKIALELRTTFFTEDLNDYNVVADLTGGDAAIGGEFSMLGAHLDSWQSGTGSTDNGCGSAVVIEASRLIAEYCKKAGIKPRRTVRACLWSGEEQGLMGSRAYAKDHLGEWVQQAAAAEGGPRMEELRTKPGHAQVAGYFNLDNGTGKVRGVYMEGNEAVAPIFRSWLRPFHTHGASTLTLDTTGGTDHQAFDGLGVPGFQFIQDAVSYSPRTHHSNMDVWDHAIADDLMQASVVMATFVWQTAQRDEKLPRKPVRPREVREGRRGGGRGAAEAAGPGAPGIR
ncbi:MAG TPA: M28 family peptidase [Planctomycetota bacterium]|nr:M28 family peptidase [Planctomycetota bacterium]